MRWKGRRQSENVEDRRYVSKRGATLAGGGIGGVVILLIAMYFGIDRQQLAPLLQQEPAPGQQQAGPRDAVEDELTEFVSVVLADTEEVWHDQFSKMGLQYKEPTLVVFRKETDSACGRASAGGGPFYCPRDEMVYIDLKFYQELKDRFQAPGDFAQAYVIAHEVGHHVQKLLGTLKKVQDQHRRISEEDYNELSVRLELQADFYAGVWAHYAQRMQVLEEGDIQEALGAASAIGDDRIQEQAQGYVEPESFTHGTSDQRSRWFLKGFRLGDPSQGDTFGIAAEQL